VTNRLVDTFIDPGLALVPSHLDTPAARAMLVAIAYQESGFTHRRQIRGPARGWWQFEPIGVRGVLTHHASQTMAEQVCAWLVYPHVTDPLYQAVEHNDALACAFARLLLWRFPDPLPEQHDAEEGWKQYQSLWSPGKPHPERWPDNYARGWEAVLS